MESTLSTTWASLYEAAKAVQRPRHVSSYIEAGGVAAAVESSSGRIYTGVCVDTACTLGICAERNAILNMMTNGEDAIRRVLTIMRDGRTGPPCGACREMMTQLMPSRFGDIEVMIDFAAGKTMSLANLTPQWWLRRWGCDRWAPLCGFLPPPIHQRQADAGTRRPEPDRGASR